MIKTNELNACQTRLPDGQWVPKLPHPAPFRVRLRDAWQVLIGKAEAVTES